MDALPYLFDLLNPILFCSTTYVFYCTRTYFYACFLNVVHMHIAASPPSISRPPLGLDLAARPLSNGRTDIGLTFCSLKQTADWRSKQPSHVIEEKEGGGKEKVALPRSLSLFLARRASVGAAFQHQKLDWQQTDGRADQGEN